MIKQTFFVCLTITIHLSIFINGEKSWLSNARSKRYSYDEDELLYRLRNWLTQDEKSPIEQLCNEKCSRFASYFQGEWKSKTYTLCYESCLKNETSTSQHERDSAIELTTTTTTTTTMKTSEPKFILNPWCQNLCEQIYRNYHESDKMDEMLKCEGRCRIQDIADTY